MRIELRTGPACPTPGQHCPNPAQNPGPEGVWGIDAAIGAGGRGQPNCGSGFTLVETLVATFIAAIVLPTIYAGLAVGFSMIQIAREDQRATQVIVQRMEAIRLSPYTALQDAAAYPTNVTEYYSPGGQTNGTGGAAYKVTYTWTPVSTFGSLMPPCYRSNMVLVTVGATWRSGKVERTRSMQTYVARYGIRRYVCGN